MLLSEDQSPPRPRIPFVVLALASAIAAAFVLTGQYDPERHEGVYDQFAIVPERFNGAAPDHYRSLVEAAAPLFGHVFVHAGIAHILMNMIAFFQASPFLAQRLGGVRYLVLFFASALGGAGAYYLLNPHDAAGMVGASGAICGLFGGYFLGVRPSPREALADPQVRNAMLMFLGINVVLMAFLPLPIAWQAHLGGFVTGALVYLLLAPKYRRGPWG